LDESTAARREDQFAPLDQGKRTRGVREKTADPFGLGTREAEKNWNAGPGFFRFMPGAEKY
jgi:hypothetical protein